MTSPLSLLLTALAAAASPVTALTATHSCPTLAELEAFSCFASEHGWFYASSLDEARALAEDARVTSERFSHYFARSAPSGAIIASGTGATTSTLTTTELRKRGAAWVLPWLDTSDRTRVLAMQVEKQIREQLPDATEDDIAALMTQAQRQLPDAASEVGVDRGALRHEVGHLLLLAAFWPQPIDSSADIGPGHYGSAGPDWLDETAAVLMETQEMADSRRQLLARLAHPSDLAEAVADAGLQTLPAFFASEHPLARIDQLLDDARPEGSSIRIYTGEQARTMAEAGGNYYAQARGVADFLIATSGNEQVFGAIATALAEGKSMDEWLSGNGAQFGLPASMAGLESAWTRYLAGLSP